MSKGETRVVVVDDHKYARAGVCSLLEKADDIAVVGEAESSASAVEVVRGLKPDVVVLDLQMPDSDGAQGCRRLAEASPDSRVLVLSAFLNPYLLGACLEQGVSGYVLKDAENLDIANAVRVVAAGGMVFDRRVRNMQQEVLGGARGFETPTPREVQVLMLMGKGLTNQEIAECLKVSPNTVKSHVKEIMRKLGCRNRVEVVVKARARYLI